MHLSKYTHRYTHTHMVGLSILLSHLSLAHLVLTGMLLQLICYLTLFILFLSFGNLLGNWCVTGV